MIGYAPSSRRARASRLQCDARLALPGFHVFLNAPLFRDAPASMHYDLQYELLDWTPIGEPDTSTQLSLTLSLALPSGGGGLLVWNINRLEIAKMTPPQRRAHSAENRVADYKPYTVGHLAVHSGHQLHQIAPAREAEPEDMRVTMQAHALRVGSRWVVYLVGLPKSEVGSRKSEVKLEARAPLKAPLPTHSDFTVPSTTASSP